MARFHQFAGVVVALVLVIFVMDIIEAAPFGHAQQSAIGRKSTAEKLKFYEVDALGDDYVDFGAQTGPRGAFSWHATYRLE